MKKLIVILSILGIVATACNSTNESKTNNSDVQTTVDSGVVSKIKFDVYEKDFGKIVNGEVVEFTYKFTNVGEHDLLITRVKPSCGCTTPKWTKEVVPPGGEGEIAIKFNSTGRSGKNTKTVKVFANTMPAETTLKFFAEVVNKQ